MRPLCQTGSSSEEIGAARAAPCLTACLLLTSLFGRKGQRGNLCCEQVDAKAEQGSGTGHGCEDVADNDHSPYMAVAAPHVSEFPLHPQWSTRGSTTAISTWVYAFAACLSLVEGPEPFPFGATRTKTGSDDSARGFCRKEVCLVHTTSIDTKIVVKRK